MLGSSKQTLPERTLVKVVEREPEDFNVVLFVFGFGLLPVNLKSLKLFVCLQVDDGSDPSFAHLDDVVLGFRVRAYHDVCVANFREIQTALEVAVDFVDKSVDDPRALARLLCLALAAECPLVVKWRH